MFMHILDHVHAEPKLEVHEEQVLEVFERPQAIRCVDTNIAFEQGKPQYIPPYSLTFIFNYYFMLSLIVH
jgi:hypothetical protein